MADCDFDWNDEARRDRYLAAWKEAAERCDLHRGDECEAFKRCSGVTQMFGERLWKLYHDYDGRREGLHSDSIPVEGETLLHGCVTWLFPNGPTDFDVEQTALALDEMVDAGLVYQQTPGRWLMHFGSSYSPERLAELEAQRVLDGERYAYPRRAKRGPAPGGGSNVH